MGRKLMLVALVWGLVEITVLPTSPARQAGVAAASRAKALVAQAQRSGFSMPAAPEYVQIDGGKNPELIPEWTVWSFAFRVIAGGSRLIPTVVLRHLSKEEAALLLAESDTDQQMDAACQQRVLKLRPLHATERADVINRKTREIQLECRRQTLEARDRVLAALGPAGQIALTQWVESTKAAMQVSVPRRELAHYRQPQ